MVSEKKRGKTLGKKTGEKDHFSKTSNAGAYI